MSKSELNVLITGASGMIGKYVCKQFSDCNICTIGCEPDCTYRIDLSKDSPNLQLPNFDVVIHIASTTDESKAMQINFEETKKLLQLLHPQKTKQFIFISSTEVYGLRSGENIDENYPENPISNYGKSKLKAEGIVQKWCDSNNVVCTILRPAITLGNNIEGKLLLMFEAIRKGLYFNIRENEARRSLILAHDIARVIKLLIGKNGVFNVCDGKNRTITELANAMAQNLSTDKRIFYLPIKFVNSCVAFADFIQLLLPKRKRINCKEHLNILTSTLTFSNRRIIEITGINFFDSIDVTARIDSTYPYEYEY